MSTSFSERSPLKISIHALCEEGDALDYAAKIKHAQFLSTPSARRATTTASRTQRGSLFLSTPSARRATHQPAPTGIPNPISIHALCEEGDLLQQVIYNKRKYFYPRPLRGGRQKTRRPHGRLKLFLSTPSARRATKNKESFISVKPISIHALCEEGDHRGMGRQNGPQAFLSTPSARRATRTGIRIPRSMGNFYPRPLRGGRQF